MLEFDSIRKTIPKSPGVYLFKNNKGKVIYIGKAAFLPSRLAQYFQKGRPKDTKTTLLVQDIVSVDWITVDSELDALFLEAELVRRYQPKYNILLRDDKSTAYVRINLKSNHPTVMITRRPLDDKADYFGPYYNASSVRKALQLLRRAFPYSVHYKQIPKRACLQSHLGLCPGLEEEKTSLADYRQNLKKLIQYLKGNRKTLQVQIEKDMKLAAKQQQFERAAQLRNQLHTLKSLNKQIVFGDREFLDISKDAGLHGLSILLGIEKAPYRIEGYDISHMQGTDNTASMVVFTNGMPDKTEYRKFKMRLPGNNDFAHMSEVITRRLQKKHIKNWGLPDLFLIDGGKGQLQAALETRNAAGVKVPMIGLAKREEEIIISKHDSTIIFHPPEEGYITETTDFIRITLPKEEHIIKLLQRIRDESHRFAVSYHSVLKVKRQTASVLDEIPGIGPKTRQKLVKAFGSVSAVKSASLSDIAAQIGSQKAKSIQQYLQKD